MTYPNLFALWTAQGLLAFLWLIFLPSDSGNFSMGRWILLGIALALGGFSALAWFRSQTKTATLELAPVTHNILYLLALAAALAAPLTLLTLHALGQATYTYAAYASRLAPLALWFTLAGLEWLWMRRQNRQLPITNFVLRSFLIILSALALLTLLILATGWGVTPSRDGSFGHPATPFMEWQILLALAVALLAGSGTGKQGQQFRFPFPRVSLSTCLPSSLFTFLLVYLFTCLLWLSDPLLPGFFATPPRAPNFEPYPFSDALIYAQYAQQALVGEGLLWPDIPTRPLYVSSLVWLHALAGQDYYNIITLQTLWLAFFPACLYLLGKELGSRPLGFMLAILAALRDLTANHAAPFALNYTYSKLYFSEIPTALFLTIFILLATRWIKSPKPDWYSLLMGGILGAAALIRLQSAILLAPLALVSLIPLWKTRRGEWLRGLIWMTLGVTLALAPWLTRNYFAAGGLVVDNPISQSMVLARRWGGSSGNEGIPRLPKETTAEYVSRLNSMAIGHLKHEPGRILSSAANHFVNNLITSLHVFPARNQLNSPKELIWPERPFWQTEFRPLPLTIFYLFLFALGLSIAWTNLRWVGLLPLALSLGYHAWTALFLSSGDRFLVPIDWSTWLYQAWGLLVLGEVAISGLQGISPAGQTAPHNGNTIPSRLKIPAWGKVTFTAIAIMLMGASIPLSEVVFPHKYSGSTYCQLALQENETCVQGRAIYPRYYESGDGEPGTAKLGYEVSAEARLVLWLAGPQPGLVILPLKTAPAFFPHAADVWIVGAKDGESLRARVVRVEVNGKSVIYTQD